jgi:hypothetical protein
MKRQRRALRRRYGHARTDHTTRYRGADLSAKHWATNPDQWAVDIWMLNSLGVSYLAGETAGVSEKQAVDRAKRVVDAMKGD